MEPVGWIMVGIFVLILISSFVVELLGPAYLKVIDRIFGTDRFAQ
jgi:small neutral amino acid transporter SnatA (MarC family)